MHELSTIILNHLPVKKKITQKGWIWFNAPCCVHRGHKADTRQRGNLYLGTDGGAGYHCFNCGYKWKFSGDHLSNNLQEWLNWLGVDPEQTRELRMQLFQKQMQGDLPQTHVPIMKTHRWTPVPLPPQSASFRSWAAQDDPPEGFLQACAYVHGRKLLDWESYEYYWSPDQAHDMNNRVILPFYDQGEIVGWCARLCVPVSHRAPKYYNSDIPPGYLFNQDQLKKDREWCIICEGPFDAIACQGVAVMGSQLSDLQIKTILDHGQMPIILPDRLGDNQHMIDQALTFGWHVSFPEWHAEIKDAAQARETYGAIYTITSVMQAVTADPIAIQIKRKMLRG